MLMGDTGLLTMRSPVVRAYQFRMISTIYPSLVDIRPAVCLTAEKLHITLIIRSKVLVFITIESLIICSQSGIVYPLCGIHHLGYIVECREGYGTCIVQGHLTFLTLLGSNEHNTVGTTGTIDSGSRSILQYLDALDILRVDILDTTVLDNHTVYYIERSTAGTDGTLTTDGDTTHCTRTLGVGDIHTGSLTLHTLQGILYRHRCQVL